MKRILPLLLAVLLLAVLLLAACGSTPADTPSDADETSPEGEANVSADEGELTPADENQAPPPALGKVTITVNGLDSYLRLTLPEGWTWTQASVTAEGLVYTLYPEDDPDFRVELHYWPNKFAMCGTGVTITDYTLPDGRKATLATEEIGDEFNWILILPESPDAFTVQFCVKTELYEAHRAELELMLSTFQQGVLAHPNTSPTEETAE